MQQQTDDLKSKHNYQFIYSRRRHRRRTRKAYNSRYVAAVVKALLCIDVCVTPKLYVRTLFTIRRRFTCVNWTEEHIYEYLYTHTYTKTLRKGDNFPWNGYYIPLRLCACAGHSGCILLPSYFKCVCWCVRLRSTLIEASTHSRSAPYTRTDVTLV